jgi:hypothetical protein
MSNEDVIKELLKQSSDETSKLAAEKPEVIKAISDVFQSITTEAKTVNEMIEDVYLNYCKVVPGDAEAEAKAKAEEVLTELSSFITIIHDDAENKFSTSTENVYTFDNRIDIGDPTTKPTLSPKKLKDVFKFQTPFVSFKSRPKQNKIAGGTTKYEHYNKYGLLNAGAAEVGTIFTAGGVASRTINSSFKNIYNTHEICHAKADEATASSRGVEDASQLNLVNATGSGSIRNICAATKDKPSLAYILIDHPDLRIGTRNSLELSTFFNLLNTVELSKCQPYLDAVFVLPSNISSNNNGRVFKTASITQFFEGTPVSPNVTTDNFKKIEANFKRKVGSGKTAKIQDAVDTNMSAFTMPQTINNFNEKFIGHGENVQFNTDMNFARQNAVHDITRPFLTIKSFNIDVAPTQGLMSFKTGKLSLVLHDRTRMVDIAPFIKPDLFGSFGAEISIEYGWSHIDGKVENPDDKKASYLGQFLEKSRVTEKYIITNSSFTMDATGQVNIELSIAMRGPVDIRSVKLHSNPMQNIKTNSVLKSEKTFQDIVSIFNDPAHKYILDKTDGYTHTDESGANPQYIYYGKQVFPIIENLVTAIRSETNQVQLDDPKSIKEAKYEVIKSIAANLTKSVRTKWLKANTVKQIIEAFNLLDPKPTQEGKLYLSGKSRPLLYIQTHEADINNLVINAFRKDEIKILMSSILNYIDNVYNTYVVNQDSLQQKESTLINKIIGGLDKIDPFINTEFLKQYERIILGDDTSSGISVNNLGEEGENVGYVSFGSFITGLIGTHMAAVGKFDEIQIVSYTCNENCGLFSNMNVSSILLPKDELRDFLGDLFEDGTTMTLEGIISQIINRFINTRTNICYGLAEFYVIDEETGNVEAVFKEDAQKKNINDKLSTIYQMLANSGKSQQSQQTTEISDVRFVMPKIKFTFDTLTSKDSSFEKTISRISIFDQNDNPFGSVNTIMKDVYDRQIVATAAKLNKIRRDHKSTYIDKKTKKIKKKTTKNVASDMHVAVRERFYQKSWSLIKDLINQGVLIEISEGVYEIGGQFKLQGLKNSFKSIMPSITYGTQNSAVIEASVSTVNEAKLNTVYLTRSDRAVDGKNKIATKVAFSKDLPLRVLPSQANVTIYGCPFVNFAQYIFLDFETGTTIDNSYAITGIKHDLSPGKFTTQLTLSYGDVYGKYENSAQTIARTINDIVKPKSIVSAVDDVSTIKINSFKKRGDKLGKKAALIEVTKTFNGNINFNIKIVASRSNEVVIKKTGVVSDYDMIIYVNENKQGNPAELADGKSIDISLDMTNGSNDIKFFQGTAADFGMHAYAKAKNLFKTPNRIPTGGFGFDTKSLANFKSMGVNVFNKISGDFIKNSSAERLKFLKDALTQHVGFFFKLKFKYNGVGTNIEPDAINPSLTIDWNLFDKVKVANLFKAYEDVNETNNISLNPEYINKVSKILTDNNIQTIEGRKESVSFYTSTIKNIKRKQKLSAYAKPGSIMFTTAGLEFEVIDGFKFIGKKKVKVGKKTVEKIVAEFSYKKGSISLKDLLDNITDPKKLYNLKSR